MISPEQVVAVGFVLVSIAAVTIAVVESEQPKDRPPGEVERELTDLSYEHFSSLSEPQAFADQYIRGKHQLTPHVETQSGGRGIFSNRSDIVHIDVDDCLENSVYEITYTEDSLDTGLGILIPDITHEQVPGTASFSVDPTSRNLSVIPSDQSRPVLTFGRDPSTARMVPADATTQHQLAIENC